MTTSPPPRPLLPVLSRMALGLTLALGGVLLTLPAVGVRLTPGMEVQSTSLRVPLDGPLPLDLANTAQVGVFLDRANLQLGALEATDGQVLAAQVQHRARNAPQLSVGREGRRVSARLNLNVQPLVRGGLVVSGPEPVQHTVALNVTRRIPLHLSAQTTGGALRLDLRELRLQSLTTRTGSGAQVVTLPRREAGSLALISELGPVQVTALPGSRGEALRVNSVSGDLALNLRGWRAAALGVGTTGGSVRLTLPEQLGRGNVTTLTGHVTVSAPPGTRGNLDIRTQTGRVTLRVSPGTRVRVRFTDREPLTAPPGMTGAPDLDVFVDSFRNDFRLEALP